MLAAALMALATLAGNTVVTAAVTDAWEAARQGSRGCSAAVIPDRTKLAEQRLEETHDQLTAAPGRGSGADPRRAGGAVGGPAGGSAGGGPGRRG